MAKNFDLELKENFTIKEVAAEAFVKLGNTGIIEPGKAHSCPQCSQPYKAIADFILQTAISNKSWDFWERSTCFIVDSYHYINHCKSDYLCHKWCNPGPLNASAPNLVWVTQDKQGQDYLQ